MADRLDVIVVGARCAGLPLATLLARQGLKVALERTAFLEDTLSALILQAPAIKFLKRLGVPDRVCQTGTRRRGRLGRKPEFVPMTEHRDAGETEVPEEVPA